MAADILGVYETKVIDKNGSDDIYISYHHEGKEIPLRGRQCSSEELPFIKKDFASYSAFANAKLSEIVDVKDSDKKSIDQLESMIYWNESGQFKSANLSSDFQISMLRSIESFGSKFLAGGNMHHWEAESTRTDAMIPFIGQWKNTEEWDVNNASLLHDLDGEITDLISLSEKVILVLRNDQTDVLVSMLQ